MAAPSETPSVTAFWVLTLQGIRARTVQMPTALSASGHRGLDFLRLVNAKNRESLVLATRMWFGHLDAFTPCDVAAQS